MIKYCCFYCKHLNNDCPTGCYNALGGKEHLEQCLKDKICTVKNNECTQKFPFNSNSYKAHVFENCFESKEIIKDILKDDCLIKGIKKS